LKPASIKAFDEKPREDQKVKNLDTLLPDVIYTFVASSTNARIIEFEMKYQCINVLF